MAGVGGAWIRPAAYTISCTTARLGMPPGGKLALDYSQGCHLAFCTTAWCQLLACPSRFGRKCRLWNSRVLLSGSMVVDGRPTMLRSAPARGPWLGKAFSFRPGSRALRS
eukprot:400677-Amphidinium_carterae.1